MKKINVVRDKSGKVVASFEAAASGAQTMAPVLQDGERVEEIEVADNYRQQLADLYSERGK